VRRRARRLLPALTVFLLLALLVSVAAHPDRTVSFIAETVLRLSYAANFVVAFTHNGVGSGFSHLWSLAQEEQFYLLWPVVLIWLLRRGTNPRRIILGLVMFAAAICIERTVVIAGGATSQRVWFSPDTHSDPILYGCIAALVFSYRLVRIPKVVCWIAGCVAVAVMVSFNVRSEYSPVGFYPMSLIPVFAIATAVFLIGVVEHGLAQKLLVSRPLMTFGAISYALYLWHGPLIRYLGPIGVPLAVVAACLSYAFVETRFRKPSAVREDRLDDRAGVANIAGEPAG
jgi:peptidoglycan/LPS O-acetylase OafA/YrhL